MKKFTKIMALMLALVMVCFAFAGCSKPADNDAATNDNAAADTSLADVKSAGKLTIATSPDFPPFEELKNNEVVGIEIDIMKKIADSLGVELEIVEMDFDSVIPGVQAGKFDAGVSGITITEDRQKNADFTDPYFLASQAIVVMADSDIKTKADLEGKKISVQTGTTAEDYCMSNGYDVLAFVANNDACSALTSGKVDAWVVDNEVAIDLSAKTDGKTIVLDEAMTSEPYGFAFKKGSTTLVEEINTILNGFITDGTVEAIFKEYGVPYVSPVK